MGERQRMMERQVQNYLVCILDLLQENLGRILSVRLKMKHPVNRVLSRPCFFPGNSVAGQAAGKFN